MKTFTTYTLGCRLNFSEISAIAHELKAMGYEENTSAQNVDVIVVNTCAVTQQAEKKCRQTIKQLIKQSPQAQVLVTGCFSQLSAERIADIAGVDLVLGNDEKVDLPRYVNGEKSKNAKIIVSKYKDIHSFKPVYSSEGRTRCFLKIQDGCDYFCTYCTIPWARGRSRSATIEQTVEVAKEALATGAKELVLSGVNIGTFGKDNDETFFGLLKALDEVEGDFRVRLGSVEPDLLHKEMIEFVAHSKHLAPHFHLPLQSGSNEMLHLMRRRYQRELFAQRVDLILQLMPNAFIGVDVIVGMNGETFDLFEETYRFLDDLSFSQLHVFTYSERPDTKALTFEPKNSPQTKKERTHRLIELSEKKHKAFCLYNVGKTLPVIFEDQKRENEMMGYTDNYIRVKTAYNSQMINKMIRFEISEETIVM